MLMKAARNITKWLTELKPTKGGVSVRSFSGDAGTNDATITLQPDDVLGKVSRASTLEEAGLDAHALAS